MPKPSPLLSKGQGWRMTRAPTSANTACIISQHISSFPSAQGQGVLIGSQPERPKAQPVVSAPRVLAPPPMPPAAPAVHLPQQPISTRQPEAGLQHQLSSTQDLLESMKARAYARTQELRQQARNKPAVLPVRTERRSPAAQPTPTHRRKKDVTLQPEIAHQLAILNSTAAEIQGTFDELYGRDGVVVASVECRGFTVGTQHSMTSSRVDVCQDRLDYTFHHTQEGKVHMIMRYRDMKRCELDLRQLQLTFKVTRQALRNFIGDYNPDGAWARGQAGCLTCGLTCADEAQKMLQALRPVLPCLVVRG